MKPYQKDLLINLIRQDDKLADQVFKILNALNIAKITGQAIISPKSKDAPIVIISYTKELKDLIKTQLEGTGVRVSWDNDDEDGFIVHEKSVKKIDK